MLKANIHFHQHTLNYQMQLRSKADHQEQPRRKSCENDFRSEIIFDADAVASAPCKPVKATVNHTRELKALLKSRKKYEDSECETAQ